MGRVLLIRTAEGRSSTVRLEGERHSLGRSHANDLCYPEDTGLSRQHLVFEREGEDWLLLDLGSKNGTYVNGERIRGRHRLRLGDQVAAGHVVLTYNDPARPSTGTVSFVEFETAVGPAPAAVVADLRQSLAEEKAAHVKALVNAGRELAGYRPLGELFPLIMDLSLEAVKADRGVLLTLEGDTFVVRAARGDGFSISSTVRDRVIQNMESLLVRDVMSEDAFRSRESIVAQNVRSIMAVPLQTNDRVIGLIYVDTPSVVRGFSPEDLSLLTVMANVAAIRIEHARLAEVEQSERMLGRELEQAAEIQHRLLPGTPPQIAGFELAGYNVPCRTVGGDYYDFLPYPNGRIGLVVADVAGKGLPAALLMCSLHARVEVLAEDAADPARMMSRLNHQLIASCPSNRFITLFFGVLDAATGEMAYSNAGHNPPLVLRSGGEVDRLEEGGPVLGLLPSARYREGRCQVSLGDLVVLYSDGVTEAVGPEGEEFGEQRLISLVAENSGRPAGQIAEEVKKALSLWTAGRPATDDVTLVVARRV
jgi:sigma-B regulation protein RsbU (phosphoserine phosphatase)